MHSTVVVFPAPLAPISPTISPAGTSRSRPSTTTRFPYALRRPRTVTTCALSMPSMVPTHPPRARQPPAITSPLPQGGDLPRRSAPPQRSAAAPRRSAPPQRPEADEPRVPPPSSQVNPGVHPTEEASESRQRVSSG